MKMSSDNRPSWPYPSVTTMTACGNGQWRKIYAGKPYYFGPLADPKGALARWFDEWPRITAGEQRQVVKRALTSLRLDEAISQFLDAQELRVNRGDISRRTWMRQTYLGRQLARFVGGGRLVVQLGPADFNEALTGFSKNLGLHQRHEFVVFTRRCLAWACKLHGLPEPDLGDDFRVPSRAQHRREKAARGPQMFTAEQVRALLAVAPLRERGLILLGINCGMDNSGAGALLVSDIDWAAGVIRHARKKTGQGRVAPLWPETLEALKMIVAHGKPTVFITARGVPLERIGTPGVNKAVRAVIERAGLWRDGVGYYWLRRTHATVAKRIGDDTDRRIIQGHVVDDVHEGYVQEYPAERLKVVTDFVRAWLLDGTSGSLPAVWTPAAAPSGEAGGRPGSTAPAAPPTEADAP
jgi:integrase